MKEPKFGSRGRSSPARRTGAAALAVILGSAALARGATTFQASYLYNTSGPASGGTVVPIVGNQFKAGTTVGVGNPPVSVSVTFHNSTRIGATMPALTPGALYDVVVTNPGGGKRTISSGWLADFNDVAASNPFHASIESILRDQITSGCANGNYCPDNPITRAEMAVFLLKAEHGGGYNPPPATGTVFADVAAGDFAANYIEKLSAEGITSGCTSDPPGPALPNYCPAASVTRAQMAVFLLKVYDGVSHVPPAATGVFGDVPNGDPFAPWIEELARLQITVGCGAGNYCPNDPNTRGQMAVFMTKTFHRAEGIRFLEQASWGPNDGDIGTVLSLGYLSWMGSQFSLPPSDYPTFLLWPDPAPAAPVDCTVGVCHRDNYTLYPIQTRFFMNAMYNPDQLRQRVAWALHKLVVVSGTVATKPSEIGPYLNLVNQNAFGNYRDILYNVTLTPVMGNYLNMATNTNTNPNENYSREIMQLFSIGTEKLNMDGTTQNDASNPPVPLPTYDQTVIDNLKLVLTGWGIPGAHACDPASGQPAICKDYIDPMAFTASKHNTSDKVLFEGFLPDGNGVGAKTTVNFDATGYPELSASIDALFNHPTAGPYLARELIHSLVTSNPSPAYVERVAWAFNDDGNGVRGNIWAMVKAILLDPEARTAPADDPANTYGKLKEPVQYMLNLLRAFNATSNDGTADSDGNLNSQGLNMAQNTYKPPTVFSYFSQDYFAPPASDGLLGPEFGIMDAVTSLKHANFINTMTLGGGIAAQLPDTPYGTALDLTELEQLAPNAGDLVDRLDRLLMHGTMPAATRTSIITAVNGVTGTDLNLKRAQQALYLVATSSQYQVQR
ncbi:MAG: DUF1800 family protein [Acidobacteriota bacterium]